MAVDVRKLGHEKIIITALKINEAIAGKCHLLIIVSLQVCTFCDGTVSNITQGDIGASACIIFYLLIQD